MNNTDNYNFLVINNKYDRRKSFYILNFEKKNNNLFSKLNMKRNIIILQPIIFKEKN